MLNYHDKEQLEDFMIEHLTGRGERFFREMIAQLRWAEKKSGVLPSVTACELKNLMETAASLEEIRDWIENEAKKREG